MYLPALKRMAVLPVPKTSQATPTRGDQSVQSATFGISSKHRSGTKRPAGMQVGATDCRMTS